MSGKSAPEDVIVLALEQRTVDRTPVHEKANAIMREFGFNGYDVVVLPGQCEIPSSWDAECLGAWQGPALKDPVSLWPRYQREPEIALPDGSFVSLQDARDLAGALLAALKAAEAAR